MYTQDSFRISSTTNHQKTITWIVIRERELGRNRLFYLCQPNHTRAPTHVSCISPAERVTLQKMACGCPISQVLKGTLLRFAHYLFLLVGLAVRKFFEWKHGVKGGRVTPISNPLLMLSATELASKIRSKEVRLLDLRSKN